MKKIFNRFRENYIFVLPSLFALFVTFVALRIYEFVSYSNSSLESGIKAGYLNGGIILDFILTNLLVISVLLLQSLFFFRRIKNRSLINSIGLLAILLNFALIQYFLITLEPLDEVIYHFSMKDLKTIVGNNGTGFGVYFVMAGFVALFFVAFFMLRKLKFRKTFVLVSLIITLICLCCTPFLNYESNKHIANKLVNNKLVYFTIRSTVHFKQQKEEEAPTVGLKPFDYDEEFLAGEIINPEYPLLHEFVPDEKFAGLFDVKSKKAPNLVFIIVESLSTQFVGKYSDRTGHIMPFLDSLSTRGVYFPNVISTAERTYNVLPALLSSTPNAPEDKHFMPLDHPRHLSLMSLLEKYYYSRFYCGVYLQFHDMDKYLKYHHTDYLVDNWEKQFNQEFSKKNIWGHPDDQLFAKSMLDLKKKHNQIQKSRLDILLTISTHNPYLVPNQEKYIGQIASELKKRGKKNKFEQFVEQNIEKFSAFRYTDDAIRNYFREMKKRKDYSNTIFFILGDHGSELYNENELNRASTPLIIVSDLIKKPVVYEEVSSHLDIMPSILGLLNKNYHLPVPEKVPFMGKGLRLNKKFKSDLYQPVSSANYHNDYAVYGDYYLYHKQLFRIQRGLKLKAVENQALNDKIAQKVKNYNRLSRYVILKNKIISEADYENAMNKPQQYVLYSYSKQHEIKTRDKFIQLGSSYSIKKTKGNFKFEINFEYYLNKKEDLKNVPLFTVNINQKGKEVLWKNAGADLKKPFKKGWNELRYTLVLEKDELAKFTDYTINYCIFNPDQKEVFAKNLFLTSYGQ